MENCRVGRAGDRGTSATVMVWWMGSAALEMEDCQMFIGNISTGDCWASQLASKSIAQHSVHHWPKIRDAASILFGIWWGGRPS